jgi:hypothetical protein
MRIALVLAFMLALSACGKKQSPQAPASTDTQLEQDAEMKEESASPEADDPEQRSADPEEGGE